jgi:hypothetical protein
MNVYMTDDIYIKRVTFDKWGASIEKKIHTKGRITFRTKMVRNLDGEQVVSSAEVMLPDITLKHEDKVIYKSKEYSILGIEEQKDFSIRGKKVNLQ